MINVRGYKHTKAAWAQNMAERGAFLIGTFESFRGMEAKQGDPDEGRLTFHNKTALDRKDVTVDSSMAAGMARMGMAGMEGLRIGHLQMHNNTSTINHPPLYILCFSVSPQTGGAFQSDYDTMVRVDDLWDLAARLAFCHQDKLGSYCVRQVEYAPRSFDFMTTDSRAKLDPFFKDDRYRPEMEVRIAWRPSHTGGVEPFVTHCPAAMGLAKSIR